MAAHPTFSEKTSPRLTPTALSFERICQLIVLLMGARCAFAGRNLPVGADGLAYLDVAHSYLRHDWHTAINGYWGPLYSWLLAAGMRIFHPGNHAEFAVARAVNFALFAAALYAFSGFWRALAEWSKRTGDGETSIPGASPLAWIVFGYLLFVTNFIWHVDEVTPDILVATIVFATAAFLFKLNDDRQHGNVAYVWLGLLLALGYYAKAVLLYFAVFVLAAMVVQRFRSGSFRGPVTAIVVFVVLVSPFVAMVSRTLGHFTAGDSGRLNYAWFVNGPETKTWMKVSHGYAPLPFYPGPIALDSPRVFRLPSIEGVTYAPWYDAARFDKRSYPAFDLRAQIRQLAVNLPFLKDQIFGAGAALLVPLVILVWYEPRASLRHFATTWFCTLPAAFVIGMYLLVHLVQRFVLGFSLVLWGAVWASVFVPPGVQLLARRAVLAGTFVFAASTMPGLLHYVVSERTESLRRDMVIAEAVSHGGIAPDDAVASIGDGQEAYWAHLARLSVVTEVWSMDSAQFWSAPPDAQQAALRAMADSGARAVVWRADSDQPCPSEWLSLPENSGCMILLH
jgi:hypothetical protein